MVARMVRVPSLQYGVTVQSVQPSTMVRGAEPGHADGEVLGVGVVVLADAGRRAADCGVEL